MRSTTATRDLSVPLPHCLRPLLEVDHPWLQYDLPSVPGIAHCACRRLLPSIWSIDPAIRSSRIISLCSIARTSVSLPSTAPLDSRSSSVASVNGPAARINGGRPSNPLRLVWLHVQEEAQLLFVRDGVSQGAKCRQGRVSGRLESERARRGEAGGVVTRRMRRGRERGRKEGEAKHSSKRATRKRL